MDTELGVLFLTFVLGIVLSIAGVLSCLRFEPVREKFASMFLLAALRPDQQSDGHARSFLSLWL